MESVIIISMLATGVIVIVLAIMAFAAMVRAH